MKLCLLIGWFCLNYLIVLNTFVEVTVPIAIYLQPIIISIIT